MPPKYITKGLVLFVAVAFGHLTWAANGLVSEASSVFSNWKVYPATGDCGGQTLALVRHDHSKIIGGYFQHYEGNCESEKVPLTNVRFNSTTGELSFSAAEYAQDAEGKIELFAERRFSATVKGSLVTGRMQYCPTAGHSCEPWETVSLRSVKYETP